MGSPVGVARQLGAGITLLRHSGTAINVPLTQVDVCCVLSSLIHHACRWFLLPGARLTLLRGRPVFKCVADPDCVRACAGSASDDGRHAGGARSGAGLPRCARQPVFQLLKAIMRALNCSGDKDVCLHVSVGNRQNLWWRRRVGRRGRCRARSEGEADRGNAGVRHGGLQGGQPGSRVRGRRQVAVAARLAARRRRRRHRTAVQAHVCPGAVGSSTAHSHLPPRQRDDLALLKYTAIPRQKSWQAMHLRWTLVMVT